MKKWIYLLLIVIIGLVCYTLFRNAKKQVETINAVDELVIKTDSLNNTNKSLNKTVKVIYKLKDSVLIEKNSLDSILTIKNKIINRQNINLKLLKQNPIFLQKVNYIVHDTVYITETKNFWGKKKRTVEMTSNIDTFQMFESDTTE